MENKKGGYNSLFWGLGAVAAAAVVGSAYYIFNLFNAEEDLAEEDLDQIREIKQELKESSEEGSAGLSVDTAVQIMTMTNRISEEMIKKLKPDLDERRRAAINNSEEYERVCHEVLESKEWAYNEALKKVMSQFGDISMEEIQKLMTTVPPMEIEKLTHKYDKPQFESSGVPDKKLVKEAYMYYGNRFSTEMRELYRMMASQGQYDQQDQYFFLRLLVMKMKVDDELFLKYKYTEPQVKYMLFEYNLFEDPDVKRITDQLMRFESMFGGQMEQ